MFEPGNAEYSAILFERKREEEKRFVFSVEDTCLGIGRQSELTDGMRRTLIDWLTEVVEEYSLHTSTLFLAVHMIDRLLQSHTLRKNQFQLLGSGCLLIAAKIEDIMPPTLDNLVYISDYIFDEESLVLMEQKIMALLSFDVYAPTRYFFVSRFSVTFQLSPKETSLATYLLELSLQDMRMSVHPSSLVACAAIHLTLQLLRFHSESLWPSTFEAQSAYKEADLLMCIKRIRKLHWEIGDSPFQSTVKKYSSAEFHKVSEITPLNVSDLRVDAALACEMSS